MVQVLYDGQLREVFDLTFEPPSHWKQEQGSAILLVRLPGFTKEQVGVKMQNLDRVRIRGKAAGETWFCFDETFQIPEDCTTSGMQINFEDGILKVTFQKKNITQIGPKRKQAKPLTQQTLSPSKPTGEGGGGEGEKYFIPLKASPTDEQRDSTSTSTGGGDPRRVKAPRKLKSPMDIDEENNKQNREISIAHGQMTQNETRTMEVAVTRLKPRDNENTDLGDKIQTTDQAHESNKSVEAEKDGEKDRKGVENGRTSRSDEESKINAVGDGKLLMNIGVAALVIVLVRAYITFSHCFSRKPKKQNQ